MMIKNNIDRSIEYNQRDVYRDTSIRLTIAERERERRNNINESDRERERESGRGGVRMGGQLGKDNSEYRGGRLISLLMVFVLVRTWKNRWWQFD
jgi:hypothetical protein